MLVRAKETCFVDGGRRRAGQEFEFGGGLPLPSFLEPLEPVSKEEPLVEKKVRPTKKHEVTTSDEEVI